MHVLGDNIVHACLGGYMLHACLGGKYYAILWLSVQAFVQVHLGGCLNCEVGVCYEFGVQGLMDPLLHNRRLREKITLVPATYG
jgi:hypothetical protein